MITKQANYFYPNIMGRIILQSLEEILGKENIHAVLKCADMADLIESYPPDNLELSFSFDRLSQLLESLEQLYGPRGGRGLALRAGRTSFKHGLRKLGPVVGFDELAFRLASLDYKLQTGASIFAGIFNHYTDQKVKVETSDGIIFWHIERCPLCWNRISDEPICHLAVGLLQEALYWASGGKIFRVEETECVAKGDKTCTFCIEKQSIA